MTYGQGLSFTLPNPKQEKKKKKKGKEREKKERNNSLSLPPRPPPITSPPTPPTPPPSPKATISRCIVVLLHELSRATRKVQHAISAWTIRRLRLRTLVWRIGAVANNKHYYYYYL